MRPARAPKRVDALLAFMERGRWYGQHELVAIGGLRFAARLAEIARGGGNLTYDARCENAETGKFSYRLRERREGEERPKTRRNRVAELVAEVARLRGELAGYRNAWARLDGTELELLVSAKAVEVHP